MRLLDRRVALLVAGLMPGAFGCASVQRSEAGVGSMAAVHYVEFVSEDVDGLVALHQRVFGLTFSAPDADLGQARVAARPDGTLIGIRKPLAAHEQPITRTYYAVEDIQAAVKQAEAAGAVVAYGPTPQGQRGTFAILIQGGAQVGLWQR